MSINDTESRLDSIVKVVNSVDSIIKAGSLILDEKTKTCAEPYKFIQWAISKSIKIPDEIIDLAQRHNLAPKPSFFDPKNPFYSVKLKAAVSAWRSLFDNLEGCPPKKSYKEDIGNWLENYVWGSKGERLEQAAVDSLATLLNARLNIKDAKNVEKAFVSLTKEINLKSVDNYFLPSPSYLNSEHPHFCPELAVGIFVWVTFFEKGVYRVEEGITEQIKKYVRQSDSLAKCNLGQNSLKRIIFMINPFSNMRRKILKAFL